MKIDKSQKLIEKYPEMFDLWKDRIDGPDGWYELIEKLSGFIAELVPEENQEEFTVVQIKEKVGRLCYYVEFAPSFPASIKPHITDAIRQAEEHSKQVCTVCGKPGTRFVVDGWAKVLCKEHGGP